MPVPPQLAELLDRHIELFPPMNRRLFVTRRGPGGKYVPSNGQPVRANAYLKVFHEARAAALAPVQTRSMLAHVPYDLRHACVSLWLNAGVPPTQVAEWAGHSVEVLLRIYAKCIDGQDEVARRRIEAALALDEQGSADPPADGVEADTGAHATECRMRDMGGAPIRP